MCAVSMVLNQGIQGWPDIYQQPNELKHWHEWQEMYRKAQEYDVLTNQPNCEDINKLPILQKILDRLEELEKCLPRKK